MFRRHMSYPSELLPLEEYKSEIDIAELLSVHSVVFLLRKSGLNCDPKDPVKVREILPRSIDLFGCSSYSFGNYTQEHLPFLVKNDLPWKRGEKCCVATDVPWSKEDETVLPLFVK